MVNVLIRHKVQDYQRWRTAFNDALRMRRNAGEVSYRVFRSYEDANDVTVMSEFETLDRARKYAGSEELKKTMQAAGVTGTPDVQYLQEAVVIRRTAAD